MAANYLSVLRKSYIGKILFCSLLSNLVVFGSPMQEMVLSYNAAKDNKIFIGNDTSADHSTEKLPQNKLSETTAHNANALPNTPKAYFPHTEYSVFYANEKQAIIGVDPLSGVENPYDNFFTVRLPDSINVDNFEVVMAYELYGVDGAAQTTKRINNWPAYGGKVVSTSEHWSSVTETLAPGYLHAGSNEIYFNRRTDEMYRYEVKNLRVELREQKVQDIAVIGAAVVNNDGSLYFVASVPNPQVSQVEILGEVVPVCEGVLEKVFTNIPSGLKDFRINYKNEKGEQQIRIPVKQSESAPIYNFKSSSLTSSAAFFENTDLNKGFIKYDSLSITLDKEKLYSNSSLTLSGLQFKDLKATNEDMQNVTAGKFEGYRIQKMHFPDSVAVTLHIKYDEEKIPNGYSEQDIRTYYYNTAHRTWQGIAIDSLDPLNKEIIITTYDNDTDFITGVIKVPDSPETSSFAPTSMGGMQTADPGAGVVSISPPSPNNAGSAVASFPLKLPQGRNGMQPSLQVSYNSDAGNGWMGIGWDLSTPSITINTKWGVPLYDGTYESELYSLDGSDLVLKLGNGEYTSPQKTSTIPSQDERQFYERKEGAYIKIIRHGSLPSNYCWEVTDKQGDKSFYGTVDSNGAVNEQSVLRTNNTTGNIAHWALKRTQDTYGNYVDYTYEKGIETINGVTAQYFYISQIDYTLKGITNTNFYRVKFVRDNNARLDKLTNARLGFVQITNSLLSEVQIYYVDNGVNNLIRKYGFTYYGTPDASIFSNPFKKSVLKSISEYDTAGNLFYSHSMEYYDEVGTGSIINSSAATWTGQADTVAPTGVLSGIGLGTQGSALGTSTSTGGTGGFRAGFGLGFNVLSTGATLGGSASYSYNENNTQVSFIDINGDGLPDKVFKSGSAIKYRPNLGITSGSGQFGNAITIPGISKLGKTTSNTVGYGADLNLVVVGVGKSGSDTWSQSDNYFSDFNGDGLPDMVSEGQVKFNSTSGTDTNNRSFSTDAGLTENAITPGAISSQVLATMDLPTEQELRASYPQFDHVKVWEAPYTGAAKISSGNAYLSQLNSCSSNLFRFTMEWKHLVSGQWVTTVLSTTESGAATVPVSAVDVAVNKGDLIFFRVHNKQFGCGGKVRWDPSIVYQQTGTTLYYSGTDENGKNFSSFNHAIDFTLNNGGTTDVGGTSVLLNLDFNLIASTLNALNLSDAVRFTIQKIRYNTQDSDIAPIITTYQRIYTPGNPPGSELSGNISSNLLPLSMNNSPGPNQRDVLNCYVESDSNVDWALLKWKPKYTVTGSSVIQYPGVTYIPFNDNVAQKKYWLLHSQLPTPQIDPNNSADNNTTLLVMSHNFNQINWQSYLNLSNNTTPSLNVVRRKVSWVVKKRSGTSVSILHKKTFYLNYSSSSNPTYFISRNADGSQPLLTTDADYNSYFSLNLSKFTVKTIKDQSAILYSAFYLDNSRIGGVEGNYNPATITLALDSAQASNPFYSSFSSLLLPSPFLAQNAQFYGYGYRGWGQFVYNGGINSEDQSDYGLIPIDASLFDGQAQGTTAQAADQADTSTTPDDVEGMSPGMTIRYTLYQQLNGSNLYTAPSVKYKTTQGDVDVTFGPDSSNNLVASMGRFGIGDIYSQYIDVNNLAAGSGTTFIGLREFSESHGSAVSANGGIPPLTQAGTLSHATSKLNNQYIDFNGDRYPDLVTPGAIQFTGMHGGFIQTPLLQSSVVQSPGSFAEETTLGATISGLFSNSTVGDDGVRVLDGTNTQVNSGINGTSGKSKNGKQWVDINGDGLPDRVYLDTDGNRVAVNLNTGYGFSDQETTWATNISGMDISSNSGGSAGLAGGTTFPSSSFAIGLGIAKNSSSIETLFLDVNGDGLPDLVRRSSGSYQYYLNTGTSFSSTPLSFYNSSDAEQERAFAGNFFGSYTWGFSIPVPFIGAIKTTFTPTVSVTSGYNERLHGFQDIDGDGFIDVLHQSNNGNANITANLSKVGKTYLLKKVNTPLGASWTINYSKSVNSYDMPNNKWLFSNIETHDGFTADNNAGFGPDITKTVLSYSNPKYDRRERKFFGYGSVTLQQVDPANQSIYRTVVTSYHNENYYLSGVQKESILYDGALNILSKENTLYNLLDPDNPQVNPNATVENDFLQASLIPNAVALLDKSRLFITVAKATSTSYEGSQALTTEKDFVSYGSYGNLTEIRDNGEGPDDAYKTVISYHPVTQYVAYGPGFPKKVSVYKNAGSVLMREREASYYTGTGGLYEISTKLNTAAEYNKIQLEYDVYGNLTKFNDLENKNAANTSNYYREITYETVLNMFPVKVKNSFNEESFLQNYNYLFGEPALVKDVNGQSMRTRIDNRGRVIEFTGPNEMAVEATSGGNAWTIRMEYENETMLGSLLASTFMVNASGNFTAATPGLPLPTTKKHYALTRHFDPEYATGNGLTSTNQLLTISLADGFGHPLQFKKTHQIGSTMKWIINGFEKKDAFGRVLQSYLPIVESGYPSNPAAAISPTSPVYNYNPGSGIQAFNLMVYDAKDRVKTVQKTGISTLLLPGETDTSSIEYSIEDNMYVQMLINERGQTLHTYTDVRGRQRKTVQNDEITTIFKYNVINELIKVIDNENFATEYIYDLAGRKMSIRHPDRGVVTFKYDKANRMTEQSTSNLLPGGQKISYFYDCSRLARIEYPQNPQNNVKYTYGLMSNQLAVTERAVGRLLIQEDATGMQLFGYGSMGEVTKHLRSVAVANYQSYWFFTQWKYDSWNRVQEITYPDQDVVTYTYNNAGAIQAINSQMTGIAGGAVQPIISSILYNEFGERTSITHGIGNTATTTTYGYDVRRRMNNLLHSFPNSYTIDKSYTYDALSNVKTIITNSPQNSLPANGKIGGPIAHNYSYDTYNRLSHADGVYTGANDVASTYLRTNYSLDMEYNTDHTIKKKTQLQQQGYINAYTDNIINDIRHVKKTSYILDYSEYGDGAIVAGDYGYQQPHAPRTITETPSWLTNPAPNDPRIKHKKILYDANGNQTEVKEVLGEVETSLRKNLWDEENRLKAVNLKPDDPTAHPIAIYTYDAKGERTVRYNYDRIDVSSNATEVGQARKDNVMIYPSGLIMGKAARMRKDGTVTDNTLIYTKHYYIGSERISAKTGTLAKFGDYPQTLVNSKIAQMASQPASLLRTPSTATQAEARQTVLDLNGVLLGAGSQPSIPSAQQEPAMTYGSHDASLLNTYYFHPDHLGSSSYITNSAGVVSQHMEYLPFGETLIDEHLNSNNSPFKFNGKEFDEETGNYYYGARYYDSKLSIFISVDPLAEKYPGISAYAYCLNNPINMVDPTGMQALGKTDWYRDKKNILQYDPDVKSQKDLGNRGTYVGETYKEKTSSGGTANYRSDGSILYTNQKDAYQRLWTNSIARQREQLSVIGDKSVLVLPDYLNGTTSYFDEYGYSFENGNLIDATTCKTFNTIATMHVHLFGSGPSAYMIKGYGDAGFAHYHTPGKPVFVLQNNDAQEISFVISLPAKPNEKVKDIRWYDASVTEANPEINGRSIRKNFNFSRYIKTSNFLAPLKK